MAILRYALLILVIMPMGCATPSKMDCSKDEIKSWHIANGSTLAKQISYPPKAQRTQQYGKVVVALSVNEDGSADGAIKQSSGSPALDAEALKIAKANYTSPVCSGQKTSMTVDILINFDIRE